MTACSSEFDVFPIHKMAFLRLYKAPKLVSHKNLSHKNFLKFPHSGGDIKEEKDSRKW